MSASHSAVGLVPGAVQEGVGDVAVPIGAWLEVHTVGTVQQQRIGVAQGAGDSRPCIACIGTEVERAVAINGRDGQAFG